jgi:hypothetical protein
MYKMAYGTDVDETVGHGHSKKKEEPKPEDVAALRAQIAELEKKLAKVSATGGGEA